MRIAIDYSVLSTEAAIRGMGRYTQQQIREVLKRDKDNEYLILCYPGVQEDLIDSDIKKAKNTRFINLKIDEINNKYLSIPPSDYLRFSAKFQDFLYSERVDLYHKTTPFMNPVLIDFNVCPCVATLYDLIPLFFPKEYLANTDIAREYENELDFVVSCTGLISISESAKQDANQYLGYPLRNNQVAYPIVEPCFSKLSMDMKYKMEDLVTNKYSLPKQFALSITGVHHSKNAITLLKAYKELPITVQQKLPLLLVFPSPYAQLTFHNTFGAYPNVYSVNSVTEKELVLLYNMAMMVIHPSRYEGFGYPVAEAMKCGTPVITTNTSSLPEIGTEAAILVNPENSSEFTEAINMLFHDSNKRNEMSEAGLISVQRFSADQLGKATIESYFKATDNASNKPNEQKSIAIWSSLPPLSCGVADYTAELLEPLSKKCNVEVFVDDGYLPSKFLLHNYKIHHFSSYDRRNQQVNFDINIYQIGSTFFQDYMYEMIRKNPGIIVIHDLLMGLGFFAIHYQKNELKKFKNTFLLPEGKKVLVEFNKLLKNKNNPPISKLDVFFREYLILQWLMDNSLAQIVHMPDVKKELEKRYVNSNAHVVNMGVKDPLIGKNKSKIKMTRLRYGFSPESFVIGIFGSVVPVKRIEKCLTAMKQFVQDYPNSQLVIVGAFPDNSYYERLQTLVQKLDLSDNVKFTGRTSRDDFDNYFLSCDVIVNLRYPSFKGMSAILIRSLAAGKPVIISDVEEWSFFPDDFCFKIKPDQNEVNSLTVILKKLAENPVMLKDASQKARSYFENQGTLHKMANQYYEIIDQMVSKKLIN